MAALTNWLCRILTGRTTDSPVDKQVQFLRRIQWGIGKGRCGPHKKLPSIPPNPNKCEEGFTYISCGKGHRDACAG